MTKKIHTLDKLFLVDNFQIESPDIYDLVMSYIIHPIFKDNIEFQSRERKKFGISGMLEYRILVNDIQNYLNEAKTRLQSVFSIKMRYGDIQTIFSRLTRIYTSDAIEFFDLPDLIRSTSYLNPLEIKKLSGYLRLL